MNPTEDISGQTEVNKSIEQFKDGAERTGFNFSAQAKILEYIERTTRAVQERAKGNQQSEDPDALRVQLKQFGKIDYDKLIEYAKTYKMPPSFEFISPDAKPNNNKLSEFALATRAVPQAEHYGLDPKKIGAMRIENVNGEPRVVFNDIPGLAFSADKLLAACLTSKDKKSFYYPHFNQNGNLVSSSFFEVSRYQFYMIERNVREALAKRGDLKQLYPVKEVASEFGKTEIVQKQDSSVKVTHLGSGQVFDAEDGLLNFPLTETTNLDILRGASYYAAYNHKTRAMLVGDMFLDHLQSGEVLPNGIKALDLAEVTARHELNHAFWDNIPPETKKQIVGNFNENNPRFMVFVKLFAENEGYRKGAITDVQRNPNIETITVLINGRPEKLAKERIVNELIAYATWTEIVGKDVMDKINAPGDNGKPKNPMMPAASDCIASLTETQKAEIKKKLLIMDRGSKTHKDFFEPFLMGAKILAARKK